MSRPSAARAFLDTSVAARLFDDDKPSRQAAARAAVGDVDGTTLVVSSLVLADFFEAVSTGFSRPLEHVTAQRALADLADLAVVGVDRHLVAAAAATSEEHGIAMRDALAVEAAVTGGCGRILTEALPHGSSIKGVVVEDPAATPAGAQS